VKADGDASAGDRENRRTPSSLEDPTPSFTPNRAAAKVKAPNASVAERVAVTRRPDEAEASLSGAAPSWFGVGLSASPTVKAGLPDELLVPVATRVTMSAFAGSGAWAGGRRRERGRRGAWASGGLLRLRFRTREPKETVRDA